MLTGAGSGNPLQYSCLENPTDRGAWWAIVHRVTKSWTWLKELSHTHTIGSTVEPQYVLTLMLVLVFILLYHTWLQSLLKFFSHLICLTSFCTFLKWKWKSLSHVLLCNSMSYTVHGILQARILEWVAFSVSRGSYQPRNRTGVSCIAGGFFTNWAIKTNMHLFLKVWMCSVGATKLDSNFNNFSYFHWL